MSKTSSTQTKQNKDTVNLTKRLMKAVSTHCKQVSYFLVRNYLNNKLTN